MTDDSDVATFATARAISINALIWAGKWRSAVQEYLKLAEEVAGLGETLPGGLLDGSLPSGHAMSTRPPPPDQPRLVPPGTLDTGDLSGGQMQEAANMVQCRNGAHTYGPADGNGWRSCSHCGQVSIT